MKLTSLSKSVRTIGLMAMLSVVAATTLQQSAQAQFGILAKDANGVCVIVNNLYYQEFGGITFSSEQEAAHRKLYAKLRKSYEAIVPEMLDIQFKKGIGDKKISEINKASIKLGNISTYTKIELLTKQYGKFAKFSFASSSIYTPEQIAQGKQAGLDLEAETMKILTPEQQKIYSANLAVQRRIQGCGGDNNPFDRIISPLPYTLND